jgi:adenylate cyclase
MADHGRLDIAVGVAAGPVVAGQLGAAERLEWTVIGDPVNEAARLTETAKAWPERLAVSGVVVQACQDPAERIRWQPRPTLRLRGRDRDTEPWTAPRP